MRRYLVEIYENKGYKVKKVPKEIKRFLWFRNFRPGTWFTYDLIFIHPTRSGYLTEAGAWQKLAKKLSKKIKQCSNTPEFNPIPLNN
jgi:hypothetical protein